MDTKGGNDGMKPTPETFALSGWIFVRLMAIIYFFAFLAFALQARGLVGAEGILPATSWLNALAEQYGPSIYWQVPTIFWWGSSDGLLIGVAWAGVILSVLLAVGVAPGWASFSLWLLYLSVVHIGQVFFSFQWDSLQLEMGFLLIFLAPWHWRSCWANLEEPPVLIRWLAWALLFRFMIDQGAVKLLSGDEAWRDLTALTFHYETQPLPTPLAWFFHQLPLGGHRFMCALMFVIELGLPFLIWKKGTPRLVAAAGLALLQTLILLSGNHAFFNWQTIALCVLLISDQEWARLVPKMRGFQADPILVEGRVRRWVNWGVAVLVGILTLATVGRQNWLRPWMLVNSYGAFAWMTKERPEIILEGSRDGVTWEPYEFKWKVGALDRAPRWNAPYHPRLDWQMWFLGLDPQRRIPVWYENFIFRLLQGSVPVRALLAKGPFEKEPPRYIRSWVYSYHFTRRGETGWWKRELDGVYSRSASLEK
jgi:hypothetical protein